MGHGLEVTWNGGGLEEQWCVGTWNKLDFTC
jgi:hypothetical protein